MTGGEVLAEDMLFATLDPTMRDVKLPGFDKAILSDTVGFVSELPTQLVAAFRATLEEVASADILVHVRDMAHPDRDAQRDDVDNVLAQLGVGPEDEGPPPRIEAWNKVDLLGPQAKEALLTEAGAPRGCRAHLCPYRLGTRRPPRAPGRAPAKRSAALRDRRSCGRWRQDCVAARAR